MKLRFLLTIPAGVLALSGATAAGPVIAYDAATQGPPTSAGWIARHDKPASAAAELVSDPTGAFWRITDDDGKGLEDLYFRRELDANQRAAARATGFVLQWRLRIPRDTEATTRAIGTEVCVAGRDGADVLRLGFQLGRQGNELAAGVFAGKAGRVEGAVSVADGGAFHDWEAIFDPRTTLLNLTVDGRLVLATKFDHRDRGHDLVFGSRATGTGTADWRRVAFSTGLPPGHVMTPPPEPPFQTDVFVSGQGGYHSYRIPSLVTATNGALLLFCEARKVDRNDDGDIDLLLRRSVDGGRTWLAPQLVIEEGGSARIKYGNPTTVVDREAGIIWLAVNRDYLDERGGRRGGALVLLHSRDSGVTWSAPVDITARIKKPTWQHYAFGPGIGIQIEHGPHRGRMLLPANYRESFSKREPSWSHVIYSDDHGGTWKLGGRLGEFSNECQLVETLENGRSGLLFNARNHWGRAGKPDLSGRRLVSRSMDGGATWSKDAMDPALIDPPCQASLFRYSWPAKDERGLILFANPVASSRARLTLRASHDEGRTWPVSKVLYGGSAAYTCLTRLADGRIGLVYERDNYGKLTFTAFEPAWLER